jgi:Ca2+-binding RTX toxin-like protein
MADAVAPTFIKIQLDEASPLFAKNIVLTMSEAVLRGSGTLLVGASGLTLDTFDMATSERVLISGNKVTIDPVWDLSEGFFAFHFEQGALLDAAGNPSAAATLQVEVDISGVPLGAIALAPGNSFGGNIQRASDSDWFAVDLVASREYTLRLNPAGGSGLDPFLRLRDADGTTLVFDANSDDGTGAVLTYTPEASGRYYLDASSAGTSRVGNYVLSVSAGMPVGAAAITTVTVPLADARSALPASVPNSVGRAVLDSFSAARTTSATVTTGGDSTVMTGSAADRSLLVVFPEQRSTSSSVTNGSLQLRIDLPTDEGVLLTGRDDLTPEAATSFLQGIVTATYASAGPGSAGDMLRGSLAGAVQTHKGALVSAGVASTLVRAVEFPSNAFPTGTISLDATGASQNELFMLRLDQACFAGGSVSLNGIENVVLSGSGVASVASTSGARISNDIGAQAITGGAANDVFVSFGGNDTLTGGAGSDVFAFAGLGHYRITDFDTAMDKLGFNIPGVNSLGDLAPYFTGMRQTDAGVTLSFGPSVSIELMGVQASQLSVGLLAFNV